MTDEPMDVRARIIRAATDLLVAGGRSAVSTRSVSSAAGVQAPTIYRQFGDMQGLLDAVAVEAYSDYLELKRAAEMTDDPLEDLRRGWEHHVAFAVANPHTYLLLYSHETSMSDAPAKREGEGLLLALIARVAAAGRLAVDVEHAARMISAACRGVALSLIAMPVAERDARLSQDTREAVLASIILPASTDGTNNDAPGVHRVAARAIALKAVLAEAPSAMSSAEQRLLSEWLDRLSVMV